MYTRQDCKAVTGRFTPLQMPFLQPFYCNTETLQTLAYL